MCTNNELSLLCDCGMCINTVMNSRCLSPFFTLNPMKLGFECLVHCPLSAAFEASALGTIFWLELWMMAIHSVDPQF